MYTIVRTQGRIVNSISNSSASASHGDISRKTSARRHRAGKRSLGSTPEIRSSALEPTREITSRYNPREGSGEFTRTSTSQYVFDRKFDRRRYWASKHSLEPLGKSPEV
jgi:hypothetical protein